MKYFLVLMLIGVVRATPDSICGNSFEVLEGATRTVNYLHDDSYQDEMDCVFHLKSPSSGRLHITFIEFDLEAQKQCGFDYLQIFDGPDRQHSALIAKLCGYVTPEPIDTTSNIATLRFVSDTSFGKTGFILQFTLRTEQRFSGHCEPTFTKTTGSFRSPLYPQNYPNRVNCTYEIAPSTGNQILISFPTFELESSSFCIMDYVTIKTRSGRKIGPDLCGDLSGNSYLVPGSHAIVNFVSDRSSTRLGFELHYKVIASCDDVVDVCPYGCSLADDGMSRCECKIGFQAPTGEAQCYDVNECTTDNGGCQDHCSNTDGSYDCECYGRGMILSPDKHNCTDRTCSVNNAGCEQNCHLIGKGAGYHCTCNSGFVIAEDRHNCTDIDECNSEKYPHSCEQTCVNEPGSYFCDCGDGFSLSSNQRTCDDIDECLIEASNCEQGCTNLPGSWSCSCFEGYEANELDPRGCKDKDECSEENKPEHCTECIDFEGGFTCTGCDDGFVPFINQSGCIDVNECRINNGGCQQECLNTIGHYECACYAGHELVPGREDKGECQDINECGSNSLKGPCQHYCENTIGSFACHCIPGFLLSAADGVQCQDIDECATSNGGCQQNCSNTMGWFHCSCFHGYRRNDDGNCVDINECVEDKPCDADLGAICNNLEGTFTCTCPSGYKVVNKTICQDIDECQPGPFGATHGCAQRCVNTDGSFVCRCYPGYIMLNDTCTDLNECSLSICQHNELCENTLGSFTCDCREGHYLAADGIHCTDIDECAVGTGTALCSQICLNEVGSHSCACNSGYELAPDNYTCNDINECALGTSGCSDGCVNMRGRYECYCNQGFQFTSGSNHTCVDTDECAINNGNCHHVCDNSEGSFSCSCHPGYHSGSDNRCHDIDECATDNGGCGQHCHNFNGTHNCTCDPDFKLGVDNQSCGHCPTCEDFEKLQSAVTALQGVGRTNVMIRRAYQFLAAKVAMLEEKLARLSAKAGIPDL